MNTDHGPTRPLSLRRSTPSAPISVGEASIDNHSVRNGGGGGSIDVSVLSAGSVSSKATSSYRRRKSSSSDKITVYYNTPEVSSASSSSLGDESLLRRSFTIKVSNDQANTRSQRRGLNKLENRRRRSQSTSSRDALEEDEETTLDFETLMALQQASELSFRLNRDGIELVSAMPTPPPKKSFLARLISPRPQEKTYNKTIVTNKKQNSKKGVRRYLDAADDFHMPCNYY